MSEYNNRNIKGKIMDLKKTVLESIDDNIIGNDALSLIVPVSDPALGDFALPCFKFAKQLGKNPAAIAEALSKSVKTEGVVEKTEVKGGYLNFFLNRTKTAEKVLEEARSAGANYGTENIGAGKTVIVEYSSINIAKPFHIGHLGTTVIGSALYKLFKFLGYNTIGINHLGDWGTQFGKLAVAIKLWAKKEDLASMNFNTRSLQELYVRFHTEAENHPELEDAAREWFRKMEQGDPEALKILNFCKEITLKDVKKVYERLHVHFDDWSGESFYTDKMPAVLDDLRKKHLTVISEGAEMVDLSEYDMPPCLLVKSNGSTLYATRDMAAAHWRKQKYNFDKCLYVVAYQQNLHFKQFFKVLELEGCEWAKDLVHVAYGMVSLEEGSMSTRKGNAVWLEDVLDAAVKKAEAVIREKSPSLENKAETAEAVGVGAVIFGALCNARIKDITFSLDRVLNFDGETSPYLQYTHARCMSLFEKSGRSDDIASPADYGALNNPSAFETVKLIQKYPEILVDAAQKYEPSVISKYLINLAQSFNRFYLENRISGTDDSAKKARLVLTECTEAILRSGLSLLGITPVDKM